MTYNVLHRAQRPSGHNNNRVICGFVDNQLAADSKAPAQRATLAGAVKPLCSMAGCVVVNTLICHL